MICYVDFFPKVTIHMTRLQKRNYDITTKCCCGLKHSAGQNKSIQQCSMVADNESNTKWLLDGEVFHTDSIACFGNYFHPSTILIGQLNFQVILSFARQCISCQGKIKLNGMVVLYWPIIISHGGVWLHPGASTITIKQSNYKKHNTTHADNCRTKKSLKLVNINIHWSSQWKWKYGLNTENIWILEL